MENLKQEIFEILESFDNSADAFRETSVSEALKALNVEDFQALDEDLKFLLLAESMAFGFMESGNNSNNPWGTYFGPIGIFQTDDGKVVESPSIQLVTPEIIEYWDERAQKAKHPILKYRYADLVWDFQKLVTGEAPPILMVHISVDAIVEIVKKKYYKYEISAIKKLKRALSISLSTNDFERVKLIRDLIISFEDEISIDDKPGLWGLSFDELIENSKISLDEHQRNKIISDLEEILTRTSDPQSPTFSPFSAEHAAIRLSRYYKKLNQQENKKRVLKTYGTGLVASLNPANALAGATHLQHLYELFYANGMREDADALTLLIKEYNEKSRDGMKQYSHEFSISSEQIEQFLDGFASESFEKAITRLVLEFLPNKDDIAKQVEKIAAEAPLFSLTPVTIQDEDGRPVAKVGSVSDDLDGRVVMQISQLMQIEMPLLRLAVERIQQRDDFNLEFLLTYLELSPVFSADQMQILAKGIDTYIQEDVLSASHILIPMIESSLRTLLKLQNLPIYKPSRGGGLFLKNLDEILRTSEIIELLGESVAFYLRVVLTDQRGWNLRNSVCHGLLSFDGFSIGMVDRIFHIIVLLAQLRSNEN